MVSRAPSEVLAEQSCLKAFAEGCSMQIFLLCMRMEVKFQTVLASVGELVEWFYLENFEDITNAALSTSVQSAVGT